MVCRRASIRASDARFGLAFGRRNAAYLPLWRADVVRLTFRLTLLALIVGVFAQTAGAVVAGQPDRIAVFVVAVPNSDGFFDAEIHDSVRDIRSEIPKRKHLKLARVEDAADIVLRVVRRFKDTGQGGAVGVPVGTIAVALPFNTHRHTVVAEMVVGDYKRTLVGAYEGSWKEAAEQIGKEIDGWVKANGVGAIRARKVRP